MLKVVNHVDEYGERCEILENGVRLYDFEWNGEYYQDSKTGKIYRPVFAEPEEPDPVQYELLGYEECVI